MTKIAFLMLVHKDPERVVAQARALASAGDVVAIHADRRMPRAAFARIQAGIADMPGIALARRVKCGWGEYSLVQASLNLIEAARRAFEGVTHYYLLSGDCAPTKPRSYVVDYLGTGQDIIESHDFFASDWIKTGLREDRLIYHHVVNERQRKWLFYALLNLQRRLGWRRKLPKGLRVHIGSQWWALRAETVERIVGFLARRRDVARFFRTTWIPDETMFQTLVRHLVPAEEIRCQPPTSLLFSDYGIPVVFYDDHLEFLRSRPEPFARKLSANAVELQHQLFDGFASDQPISASASEGTSDLYDYLAGRGRIGRRYARRFWERAISKRRESEILVIACHDRALGRRFEAAAARISGVPGLGYLFDEPGDLNLPLGNLERGLYKREQHRHALMNLIFEELGSEKVVMVTDPTRLEVIDDIAGLAEKLRILLVERPLRESDFLAHATQRGLVTADSGDFEREEAIKAVSYQFRAAGNELAQRYTGRLFRNRLDRSRDENVTDLGHFLRLPRAQAEAVAREAEQLVD